MRIAFPLALASLLAVSFLGACSSSNATAPTCQSLNVACSTLNDDPITCGVSNCDYAYACRGDATPCESFSTATCTEQAGCSVSNGKCGGTVTPCSTYQGIALSSYATDCKAQDGCTSSANCSGGIVGDCDQIDEEVVCKDSFHSRFCKWE